MTKEIVATAIKGMPEEFHLDELFERLDFIEKVEEGLRDIEEGRTIPHEEVKKKIAEAEKDIADDKVIPNSDMQKLFEERKK